MTYVVIRKLQIKNIETFYSWFIAGFITYLCEIRPTEKKN